MYPNLFEFREYLNSYSVLYVEVAKPFCKENFPKFKNFPQSEKALKYIQTFNFFLQLPKVPAIVSHILSFFF